MTILFYIICFIHINFIFLLKSKALNFYKLILKIFLLIILTNFNRFSILYNANFQSANFLIDQVIIKKEILLRFFRNFSNQ